MKKRKLLAIFLFLFLFLNTSIANAKNEINQKPFEQLIVGYQHGLLQSLKKAKFEHLKKYLTQEIFYKTLIWVESFQASNYFMDTKMLNISFEEINIKQYSASIITSENWKYRYIDIKTNNIVIAPTKVAYKMKYYFVKLEDGTWKINHIKTLKEESEIIKIK